MEDFVPPGHVGFAWSVVLLLGVLGIGWGSWIALTLARARRLTRLQKAENDLFERRARWPLSPGPARVVHGRVEIDGDEPAIEVDVVQRVVNRTSKNSRWHEWTETSRRVLTRSFRLVRDDGQTVLVQPRDDLLVVDALETSYPIDRPNERVRSALVRSTDEVYVYGDLVTAPGGAYRGGVGFTLRAPQRGRMLVATEALRDRYTDRIRYAWRAGVWLALVFVVAHGLITTPLLEAMLVGVHEEATLVNARTYVTSGRHGEITHHELTAQTDDGLRIRGEVGVGTYRREARLFATEDSPRVPVLRVGQSTWASYLGTEPSVSILVLVMGFFFAGAAIAIVATGYARRVVWYDRKSVLERGGTGHWVETRTSRGIGPGIDPDRN